MNGGIPLDSGFVPWPAAAAARYRKAGHWQGITLGEFFERLADTHGDRVALVDSRGHRTYRALVERARRLGAGFSALGIGRGDAALLQVTNRIEWVEVFCALQFIGAVPILAQRGHRLLDLAEFAQTADAVAYIVDAAPGTEFEALARDLPRAAPTVRCVVALGFSNNATCSFDALLDCKGPPATLAGSSDAGRIALFQLSGGTTGRSKLIARTHDDYLYSIRQSAQLCGLSAQDVYLAALPVGHNFPLSSPGLLGILAAGGKAALCPEPSAATVCAWLEREAVTVTSAVPALAGLWAHHLERQPRKLPALRLLQVGGAPLAASLARKLEQTLPGALQQVFGMAEGLVCYTRLGDPAPVRQTTQGRPLSADDELRVTDEQGNDVPPGEAGQLWVRGPYTIRGYYRADLHNASTFSADGYYKTGDVVRIDSAGNLSVVGRAKEQINRAGEKFAPAEVEEQLLATGHIKACAVLGRADPYLGERCHAVVTWLGEPVPRSQAIQWLRTALLRQGLARHKVPDTFEFVSQLPLTAVGKVDKARLLEPPQS